MENITALYDSDELIISEYVNNKSNRAANAFVRKYQKFVYSTAHRYLNNYDDADEISQEVFLKALTNLHKFNKESNIKTWLYRITINQCHTFKLKNKFLSLFIRNNDLKNYENDTIDIYESLNLTDDSNNFNPVTQLETKELEKVFTKSLSKLPDKQRETFALRYFENLTYEEISQMLGISIGGLKANYFHATKKIANDILEYKKDKIKR